VGARKGARVRRGGHSAPSTTFARKESGIVEELK